MKQGIHLLRFTVSGIKNIEHEVNLDVYKRTIDRNFVPDRSRVKAIYGENHVQLVTLNITRESGKKMSNTFKFVYGDNPDINDVSDELLLNKVFEDVNTKMTDIFDILMNSDTSDWRNLYNYGFKIQ